jgi:hypothetical protein
VVLDGPQSRAFRQSEYKLFAAMSVLSWCAGAEIDKREEFISSRISESVVAAY